MQVNMGEACVCAGRFDASFGTFRYQEADIGRLEEVPPFPSAGNALPAVRVMQFPPSQSVFLAFKSFPVTPGADYQFDVPLSVSANGERAGYAAIVFRDGSGKWVRVDKVWFHPSVRNLGNAITNADGRFQVEIPRPV